MTSPEMPAMQSDLTRHDCPEESVATISPQDSAYCLGKIGVFTTAKNTLATMRNSVEALASSVLIIVPAATIATTGLAMGLFKSGGPTEAGKKIYDEIDKWNRSGQGYKPDPRYVQSIIASETSSDRHAVADLQRKKTKLEKQVNKGGPKKAKAQKQLAHVEHLIDQKNRSIGRKSKKIKKTIKPKKKGFFGF